MMKVPKCELSPTDQIQTVGRNGESQLHQCCGHSGDHSCPAGQEPCEPGILSEAIGSLFAWEPRVETSLGHLKNYLAQHSGDTPETKFL